ncbi:META domain-containing protein [Chryseobacterium sp. T1]
MCLDNNQLEERFIKALSEVNHYNINGHFLTLTNSKGEIIRFVAADWD